MMYIIDGYNQAIRYHYGNPSSPMAAIEGVCRVLSHAVFSESCSHAALVLDHPAPTYKQLEVGFYKANRPERPPELVRQLERIPDVGQIYGVRVIQAPGIEADDLIAALVRKVRAVMKVVVISSDKDLHHLVGPLCTVGELPSRFMTLEKFRRKYGLMPSQLLDYLTLVGDAADNIPPIPRHGKATATRLLQSGRSLDDLVNDPFSSVYRYREQVAVNRWLVRPLVVPVPGLHELQVNAPDHEDVDNAVKKLLEELSQAG